MALFFMAIMLHLIEYEPEGESIYIEFTFEELKPFIKRGSPLDYLFN